MSILLAQSKERRDGTKRKAEQLAAQDLLKKIDSVTSDDLIQIANEVFSDSSLSKITISSKNNLIKKAA